MNSLKQLQECGQSVWMDYIRRDTIISGELARLVEEGLSGVTSNPTLFEKAISDSSDYNDAFRKLLEADPDSGAASIYEQLSVEDIRMAADVLRPVYERTGGADGYVSIEVSPFLAADTRGSVTEARRLWSQVNRPNLMVKIPATQEGLPAIEALLGEGININITLMFSLAHYQAVVESFLRGATRCPHPDKLASVASVFLSRIDTMVDPILERMGTPEALALRGRIAIANAKVIYDAFSRLFYGERFTELRNRGVRVQRVLWGSTGTKNPAYSDVQYVEELIGPDTINTLPLPTLKAFREHGRVRCGTVKEGLSTAHTELAHLKMLGVDLASITEKLQQEGLTAFVASLRRLLARLEEQRQAV